MSIAGDLAAEARKRLGPVPELGSWPPVSIVVVNRNGVEHLRRLAKGLEGRTDYPDLELILVDNGSSDDSLPFIRSTATRFPISIVANPHNESFSDACNQGAALAGGELLLFLNNDVEPFEPGWLRELVACLVSREAGIAGATLIHPSEGSSGGYLVQHRAMRLRGDSGLLRPDLHGRGDDPLGEELGQDADSPIAAGACVLIPRDLFVRIGAFTHGYVYGGEDIDLGMKVLEQGLTIVYSGRSLLIHRLGSTRAKQGFAWQHAISGGNARMFWERWGPRVRREYELDRLAGGGFWATPGESPEGRPTEAQALALGFCLRSSELAATDPLDVLHAELVRRGNRSLVLRGDRADDLAGFDYDVAVYLHGPARYIPKPGQLNVLWAPSRQNAPTDRTRSL